ASATSSGGVGGFFSKLFGSKAADQDAPSTQPALVSKPKRTAVAKPGQSAAPRPKHEPQSAETKTAAAAAKTPAPKQEPSEEPQRSTASTTGALTGAAPTRPSGGSDARCCTWNT